MATDQLRKYFFFHPHLELLLPAYGQRLRSDAVALHLFGYNVDLSTVSEAGQEELAKELVDTVATGASSGFVLVDSNLVFNLRADPTLGGRVGPNEQVAVSYVTGPELRNVALQRPGKVFVPRALSTLPVLEERPSIDLIVQLRGSMVKMRGKFGAAIIGAQALESEIPLVTNDEELAGLIEGFGGIVRRQE